MTVPVQLIGGRVATPDGLLDGLAVTLRDDRIVSVGPKSSGVREVDVRGALIAPGFIDTHVHGGLRDDTMDGDPGALVAISRHLAHYGVTAWVPTTVACPAEQLDRILTAIAEARASATGGAEILGAHLESNFLAAKYNGAQPLEHLRPPDDPELLAVIEKHRETIRIVTLAPELPGALDLIRQLVAWDIVVAVGHTDATYDQVRAAVEAGARRVTHLCNAQRGFHHREPGTLGAGLSFDELATEIIADLEHVHPAGLTIAYRCKGPEKLMLVTDALRGTGLPPGRYDLGGQETILDGRVARLASGTIAGSTMTLDRAVSNLVHAARVPLAHALQAASAAPARSLGLEDRGAIAPGMRADLVLLDENLHPRATMVGGAWVSGELAEAGV